MTTLEDLFDTVLAAKDEFDRLKTRNHLLETKLDAYELSLQHALKGTTLCLEPTHFRGLGVYNDEPMPEPTHFCAKEKGHRDSHSMVAKMYLMEEELKLLRRKLAEKV